MECKLDNITIHYEIIGAGRPILMLHGGYLDHRHMMTCMEPVFEKRDGWKRIYPDMPGQGKTSDADWITSLDDVLDVVLEFIDMVILGQNFVVAGASRGGYLARGLVYRKPELIDGVFLDVPATYAVAPETSVPQHTILAREKGFDSELQEHEQGLFDTMVVVHSQKVLDRMRQDFFPAFNVADDEHQAKIMANYEFSFAVDNLSKPFEKPTLILMGRQDSSVGYRDAWNFLENYPRATFAILDRAGHFLQLEQEKLFFVLVDEWLQRVEEFGGSRHKRGLDYLQSIGNSQK